MTRQVGLRRQLLLPSRPGASLLLVLLFGALPMLFGDRVPGALLSWIHPVAATLLTAAMIVGLVPGLSRLALRVAAAGFIATFLALCAFAAVAGRVYGGRSIALACGLVLTAWGVQILGWWLDEGEATSRERLDHV